MEPGLKVEIANIGFLIYGTHTSFIENKIVQVRRSMTEKGCKGYMYGIVETRSMFTYPTEERERKASIQRFYTKGES